MRYLLATPLALLLIQGEFFTTPLAPDDMHNKQAVVETSQGTIIIEFLPEVAPNHVGYFMKLASDGAFDGTTFHRMVLHGIIQGGDPLSKDPEKGRLYGTGGLNRLKAEFNAEKHTRGAVSAVRLPGKNDSAGSQFFICVVDQPSLDGQYTVFGRVVEGMHVVEKISETPTNEKQIATERVEITSVTVRDKPPPEPPPFAEETVAELASYRAILDTSLGPVTLEFLPDKAPNHVRNFLRLASLGAYDGCPFHRVVPGFVIQTGDITKRRQAPTDEVMKWIPERLEPEFNDTPHVKGILSMARADAPDSATTQFFICTAEASYLDGKYTAFGRVVDGIRVVEAIEALPTDGETPLTPLFLSRVRLERKEE
jgi:peptidyl-prolyl cis-trans isomerase B (cyclophilin B)